MFNLSREQIKKLEPKKPIDPLRKYKQFKQKQLLQQDSRYQEIKQEIILSLKNLKWDDIDIKDRQIFQDQYNEKMKKYEQDYERWKTQFYVNQKNISECQNSPINTELISQMKNFQPLWDQHQNM